MVMVMMVVMLMTGIEGVVGDGVERTYRLDNPVPSLLNHVIGLALFFIFLFHLFRQRSAFRTAR